MKFLAGLQTKQAPVSGAISRATGLRMGSYYNSNIIGQWDIDQAVVRGYERVIMVFRCIDAIAMATASLELLVREDNDKNGRIVIDNQLRYVLNKRSNTYESAVQFRYRLASQLLMSRKGVFIERINNRAGRVAELHLLNPSNVTVIKDARIFVSGYKVRGADGGEQTLDPSQVIWIKAKPHPTDPYQQMTPIVAAGLAIDTEYLSRLYNRNFVANDGRPGMLITLAGRLNDEDALELKRRFSGGPATAGETSVIEADGMNVQDLGATPHDMQFLQGLTVSKEDIQLAFGTPESVLGNASGRTFDNADAERLNWYMDTVVNFGDAIGSGLDSLTSPIDVVDNLYVAHNWDEVDVLQRAKQAREAKALADFNAGVITYDDYCIITGRLPFGVPGTQVLWITAGKLPIGRDEATTEAAQKLIPTMPPPVAGMTPEQMQQFAENGAQAGVVAGQQAAAVTQGNNAAARAVASAKQLRSIVDGKTRVTRQTNHINTKSIEGHVVSVEDRIIDTTESKNIDPYADTRYVYEGEMIGMLSSWDRRQEESITTTLVSVRARKDTRHWEGEGSGTKALNSEAITNPDRWAADIKADFEPMLRRVAEKQLATTTKVLSTKGIIASVTASGNGNPMGVNPVDQLFGTPLASKTAVDTIVQSVSDLIETAAKNQSLRIQAKIKRMDDEGASVTAIKREVTRMVGARSTWKKMLATNATTALIEGTTNSALAMCGPFVEKGWVAHHDEKTRHTHRVADGQVVKGNEKFAVGEVKMDHPCDPTAPPSETANCRCSVWFRQAS